MHSTNILHVWLDGGIVQHVGGLFEVGQSETVFSVYVVLLGSEVSLMPRATGGLGHQVTNP